MKRYDPRHAVIRAVNSLSRTQRRFAVGGAAVVAVAGMAVAGLASASVSSATIGTSDGTAGYIQTQLGTNYTTFEDTFTLNPDAKSLGVTTNLADPNGAEGAGLCNNGTGKAAEEGVVENADQTFNLVYALGALGAGTGLDECVNHGILTNGASVHPLLSQLAAGDNVTILGIEYRGGMQFSARDNSTGQSFEQWVSFRSCTRHPGYWTGKGKHRKWHKAYNVCKTSHPYYNEALVGVMQSLSNLGGAATNDLVDFYGARVDGLPFGSGSNVAEAVYSSADASSPWLVGPADSITTGPNGEGCKSSSDAYPALGLAANSNQFGSLAPSGNFSICAATATGA